MLRPLRRERFCVMVDGRECEDHEQGTGKNQHQYKEEDGETAPRTPTAESQFADHADGR